MSTITQTYIERTKELLSSCIGKTILDIDYDGLSSELITIKFTDNTAISIDADGDGICRTFVSEADFWDGDESDKYLE
jgi:hypothetical protein